MLLKDLSYYGTGGDVDHLYTPTSISELSDMMAEIHSGNTLYFLLGAGSNSLVMDDHWPGAVVVFNRLNSYSHSDLGVTAQAGMDNSQFAELCFELSLQGASWMNRLPGQLGSTVRMNARCYGGEISQIVNSVTAVTTQGEVKKYRGNEVFRGYKSTAFMDNNEVVAEISFSLEKGDQEQIRQHMDFCERDRNSKYQFLFPSCGCVFKNDYDVGIPSGLILDHAGVRKLNTEQVEISPYHANFVFNKGASAREILETTLNMRELTYEAFGVWLAFEMEILGIIPDDLKRRVFEQRVSKPKEQELNLLREKFKQT